MIELLICNKRTGQIFSVADCTQSITWETNRTGSPGTLNFKINKSGGLDFLEGDIVRFSENGQLQFYGWVFTKSKNRWGEIEVTCYDRLRYLKANASYAFYNQTAGEILQQIAEDLEIETGMIEDTGYAIPSLIEEDQSCLDILESAIQQTLLNTGRLFVLYDDGSGVALRECANLISNVILGTQSLLTEYTYKTDIDDQVYNSVKLARPNEETGRASVYIAQDGHNIGLWGLLQLYQKVDEELNDAQMKARAEETLAYYNRRRRSLSVSALGVPGLRAGQLMLMRIPDLGDIDLDQYMLIEQITHTWENDKHEMEIETREF